MGDTQRDTYRTLATTHARTEEDAGERIIMCLEICDLVRDVCAVAHAQRTGERTMRIDQPGFFGMYKQRVHVARPNGR